MNTEKCTECQFEEDHSQSCSKYEEEEFDEIKEGRREMRDEIIDLLKSYLSHSGTIEISEVLVDIRKIKI